MNNAIPLVGRICVSFLICFYIGIRRICDDVELKVQMNHSLHSASACTQYLIWMHGREPIQYLAANISLPKLAHEFKVFSIANYWAMLTAMTVKFGIASTIVINSCLATATYLNTWTVTEQQLVLMTSTIHVTRNLFLWPRQCICILTSPIWCSFWT